MSEAAGRDVGTQAAIKDYLKHVLPAAPQPLDETLGEVTGPIEALTGPLDEPAAARGEWT
jgi:hypothetical protein